MLDAAHTELSFVTTASKVSNFVQFRFFALVNFNAIAT